MPIQFTAARVCTVRAPFPELVPYFKIRQEEEGEESLSQYFFWLGFYDVFLRKPHRLTPWIKTKRFDEQHEIVQRVIDNFDKPHKPGGFFETRVQEAAGEELWKLHAQVRDLKEQNLELASRVRELEAEFAKQGVSAASV